VAEPVPPEGGSSSPQGRRVLVAPVTGAIGERIQTWRLAHDPAQARRLPPHATLCYWAPTVAPPLLEAQVRHAFAAPVTVRLGGVREFANPELTFYVEIRETAALDAARARLYDGAHLALPGTPDWPWHVTCVRSTLGRDPATLRAAARELDLDAPWRLETVAYLELRGDRYEPLAEWRVGDAPA
jgi:hypothetical protein